MEVFQRAVQLLFGFDKEVLGIVLLSLRVSLTATIISSSVAVPIAMTISMKDFPGKRAIILVINSFLSIPAVAIGLILYLIFTRQGLIGFLGLLYTPWAMIIAQAMLIFPIITSLTIAAIDGIKKPLIDTAITLGADSRQIVWTIFKEARYPMMAAFIMGFSRIIGETGMTMMVGGNIKGSTRVMTTAIALQTMRGEFELGVALAIILLIISFILNIFLQVLQGTGARK